MNKTEVKGFIRIEYNNQIWYEISQKEIYVKLQEKKQITYSTNSAGTARRRTTSEGSSLSG